MRIRHLYGCAVTSAIPCMSLHRKTRAQRKISEPGWYRASFQWTYKSVVDRIASSAPVYIYPNSCSIVCSICCRSIVCDVLCIRCMSTISAKWLIFAWIHVGFERWDRWIFGWSLTIFHGPSFHRHSEVVSQWSELLGFGEPRQRVSLTTWRLTIHRTILLVYPWPHPTEHCENEKRLNWLVYEE